jgi:hypothetical protein
MGEDPWDALVEQSEAFRRALGRSRASRVSAASLRDAAKALVQQYFRRTRPYLMELGSGPDLLLRLDEEMQNLLRLSQGRSQRQLYVDSLRRVRGLQREAKAAREVRLGEIATRGTSEALVLSSVENQILETLQRLIPSAALSYEQAIRDLHAADRLSSRGTANELRETLREVLDHLAPDSEVMSTEGFQLESGQGRPTQKQKVRYILRSRGLGRTALKAPEDSVALVEELISALARSTYERGSVSAHVASARREVQQVKMYVDGVLAELLEIHR